MHAPDKHILATIVIVLSSLSTGVMSIKCYQCRINPLPGHYYNNTNLCVHFDHSKRFVVDCPFSTMCMKQNFRLDILGGVTINGVLRDCASQKNEYHYYMNGSWFPNLTIEEPYKEGCHDVDDKGERTTSHNQYCYCRQNLCNASPATNHEGYTDIMGVIVVFNLMKYINSLR